MTVNYTPISYTDFTISNPSTLSYNFTKEILQASHIAVYQKPLNGNWTEITDFTATGSSGSIVVTLGGSVALAGNDTLRIARETPRPGSSRLVDFQNGDGLSEDDLDTSALQNLYVGQEAYDSVFARSLTKGEDQAGGDANYDANGVRIKNLAAPVLGSDAARYQDITALSISSGNLPAVTAGQEASMLVVKSSAWTIRSNGEVGADLGLGAAAYKGVGVTASDVIDKTYGDTLYLTRTGLLADLSNTGTAQTNLGLGTCAPLNVGTSANNVIQLDTNARLPAVDGRSLDLSLNSVQYGRTKGLVVIPLKTGQFGNSAISVGLDPIKFNYLSSVVTVSGASNKILVQAAGGIKITTDMYIGNTGVTERQFTASLRQNPAGVSSNLWTSQNIQVRTGSVLMTSPFHYHEEYCGILTNYTEYDVRINEITTSTQNLRIYTGSISIEILT